MTENCLSLPSPSAVKIFECQTFERSSEIKSFKHYTNEIWLYTSFEASIITSNHN